MKPSFTTSFEVFLKTFLVSKKIIFQLYLFSLMSQFRRSAWQKSSLKTNATSCY